MKKNLTMQLLPLWLLAFFFFASVPIKAQTYSEATPRIGIVKMIGCGTGTEANKAQIQVIHDGTGYSYNFGANASDVNGSTAWVPAGTRTVTVTKGAKAYKLPITVPAKVVPTFTPTVTYNCNGTADVRLTNNQGTYNYTYTYGGNTHNSPYFRDLAVGQHTITVKYTQPIAERDIVFFDDFGTKETGDPRAVRSKYAISTMNFAPLNGTQVKPDGTILTGVNLRNDACYTVATKADADTENVPTTWLYPNDKDGKANGRYLYYDAYTINQNLYTRKAKVKPNTPVNFSAYLFNTVKTTYNSGLGATYTVRVTLDIYANEAAAQAGTAPLFRSYYFNVPAATTDADKWYPINVTANISGSYSELVFVVRMYGDSLNGGIGNDIALDNVLVTQPTAICEQTLAVPVNVVTNTNTYSTTVTYNCAANNATIKVTPSVTTGYTYTYKLDNGTAGSNNTFNNVAVGVHTLTLTSQYTGAKVIFKEDFGSGAPYRLPETVVPKPFVCKDVLYGYPADILPEGHYQVANVNNLTQMNTWNWRSPKDHTNSTDGQGRYLAFNHGANANKPFYKQDIRVEANKPVTVEYYAYNINKNSTVDLPKIKVKLVNKATNAVVHTSSTYAVTGNTSDTDWRKVTFTFTPPVNARDLELNFINEENSEGSNDFAIDDILVTQAYEVCTTTLTATVAPKVTRAFAGVTKLIGCGTGANANKAEVTIANVEGGSGAYEYNFGGTWTTTNADWLAAGTHTVSVRAVGTGNSCQYDMSVTVPAAIAQPTIKTAVHYACDGKAILNIGVENPDPALKYLYSLDGAAYTTTYLYTGVTSGTHSVSVQYEHRSVPSPVMLWKEDFGTGNPTTNTAVNTTHFTFKDPRTNSVGGYGEYTVAAYKDLATPNKFEVERGVPYPTNSNGVWRAVFKGTTTGANDDRYLYVDMANNTYDKVFLEKEVDIHPHNLIEFGYQIRSYNGPVIYLGNPIENPNMQIKIVDASNPSNVLGAINSGKIPHDGQWHLVSSRDLGTINPNGVTRVKIQFINKEPSSWGNDLAIDDITVWQVPQTCGQVVSATKVVTANNQDIPAFTVSKTYNCATGKGALTVTPTATTGFTYTYTLGSTTYTGTTATFTGLDLEQTYTVSVSYQAVSNTITLLNEDFGVGSVTMSPYVPSEYNYQPIDGQIHGNHPRDYRVAQDHNTTISDPYWYHPTDHTNKPNGRMLFLWPKDEANEIIYKREISVVPNQDLDYSIWIMNYVKSSYASPTTDPQIQLLFYKTEADVIANNYILVNGGAPETKTVGRAISASDWKQLKGKLTAANVGNANKLILVVKSHTNIVPGNDFALDDIVVTQKLSACITSVTATLTKGDVATPTLTLPANLSVICSAPTASATISSWIASATATSTCGTATVTHNYSYPSNLCNVGGAVTVTFSTTDPFGNVVTATRVISFATMTLTVTPTTLSVPNGALGGTTSSVVPNITLGGVASPSTNSVTITFSGLPTGVTSTTGGRLIVAPNTPAGSHTITYRVCETAGHNNCKTVNTQLVIGAATPTVSTETFTASTTTATVVPGTIGNILTNASVGARSATAGVGGNVTITLTHTPTIPNAPQINPSTGSVTVSSNTPPGVYTITYTLCSAVSTCVPGVATITVPQLKPYIPNTTITHSGTQTTTRNILDGGKVNGGTQSATVGIGGTVTITSVTNPTPRTPGAPVPTLNPATGIVTVPPTTPNGTYTISYTVCTTATPTNCTTGVTTVVVANVTPTVVPDAFTASTTTATVVPGVIGNVLTNDRVGTQSATTGVGGNVTINVTRTPTTPNAPVLDASTGSVTVSGNTPAGVYSISYKVCNGALCTAATLTVTVPQLKPYIPAANITHSGTTTTTYTVTTGGSVKGGTQSATTGTGGTVTITNVVNPTPRTPGAPVPSLNPNNGVITVPPTTPNGVYTITYDVCTTATPTACSSHVATVTVGSVTPTEVPEANDITAYTRINTPVTVGVTSSTTVTVSIPSQPANGTAVSNGDGTITYTPNNGFKGTDSFEYSLCNAAGCRTATISVRVTSELIIYNGVSIGGSDKNNHFHIEGIENYPNNTVRIYNRWGVKVFEMSGYNNTTKAFRGVSDARATLEASDNLPQGTYYYIVEYVDEHNKTQTETGWLYLKKN